MRSRTNWKSIETTDYKTLKELMKEDFLNYPPKGKRGMDRPKNRWPDTVKSEQV